MKPPSLLRSLVFWGGLLVMGFIVWAWRDSWRYDSYLLCRSYSWKSAWGGVVVLHGHGLLADPVETGRERKAGREGRDFLQRPFFVRAEGIDGESPLWTRRGPIPEYPSFHEYTREEMRTEPLGTWVLYAPYWLLMGIAGALWAGLLVWRLHQQGSR
jgi:hypothetical protein